MKDSTKNNISKIVGGSIQTTAIVKEADNVKKIINHSSTISNLMKRANEISDVFGIFDDFLTNEITEKTAYNIYDKVNAWKKAGIGKRWTKELAKITVYNIYDEVDALEKAGSGAKLFQFIGIGTVINIGIGAYCTHNFCESLINKFADYYRKNASKITNSYKKALSYFNEFKD